MAGKIFINYRRDDSANIAQYLEREFGTTNVFIDIDRMRIARIPAFAGMTKQEVLVETFRSQ